MPTPGFIHLRVHTAYSLSEGAIRVAALADLCQKQGMPAVAVTDTNNLFGGMDISAALKKAGVQPIIGCQLTLARQATGNARDRAPAAATAPAADAVVLLVQNPAGYRNLLKLLAIAYDGGADGAAAEPRVAAADLAAHAGGLILLTGGAEGPFGRLLLEGRGEAADALLGMLAAAFDGRLYVELQRHGLEQEAATEPALLDLASRHNLPIVATNDAYFTTPEMYEAHDALLAIADGQHLASNERRRVTPEHYLKSAAEMQALFSDLPDACANTVAIARRCAFAIEAIKPLLPPYDGGEGLSEEDALRRDAAAGLERRFAELAQTPTGAAKDEAPYRERLAFELDVICRMGFSGYFLIVAEFIQWAKRHRIPVGPGRGSGAGSVVAWALAITDLDPLRFGLLFERFLNPERVSMPDFDIDFCQDRRDEVIQHVEEKYGHDRVAQIITFGKLQARAVLRDVGRVMGLPYGQVDRLCKLVPNNPAKPVTLAEAIKGEPQLQAAQEADETVARLINVALKLEGLYRHASTHAAGVVIAGRPLSELIPLYRDPRSQMLVTGFNMKWIEQAGLVKFDFLGLKTLTVLVHAVELLRQRGIDIDLSRLPLDDRPTFEMLGKGDTTGVFQLESSGMRDVLRKLRPDTFEDIIAVVALYRPGPMDNIPSYIKRKHGEEKPDFLYPSLEPILRETHGIMIYQEQVMQIAQVLSGFTLGGADLLRRAMGKKDQKEMDRQQAAFVEGAVARSVPKTRAESIFELVNKFAGYGFNKSHAAAYALIAYQTAYLKANHPRAFFAASMTLDLNNTDKLNHYRQELDRLGIPLLPPDINASEVTFAVEAGEPDGQAGGIRYALAAVKTVGEPAARAIVEERRRVGPYRSLADFAERLDCRAVNKRQVEAIARAGAFDQFESNRRRVVTGAETIIRRAQAASAERQDGQAGLFAGSATKQTQPALQLGAVDDWPPLERLNEELEAVGFYLSAHPLDAYGTKLARLGVSRWSDVLAGGRSGAVTLAGTVLSMKVRTSQKGAKYAFVQLSDSTGAFEVTVFSEQLAAARDGLDAGSCLIIQAAAQFEGESVRLTAQKIEALDAVVARLSDGLDLHIDSDAPLPAIRDALAAAGTGRGRVKLVIWLGGSREIDIVLPGTCRITPTLAARLRTIQGVRDVRDA